MTGLQQLIDCLQQHTRQVMLDKTIKEMYSVDAALPNTHTICSTTSKLQKYTDLTIWQLNTVCILTLALSTTGIIPKKNSQQPETAPFLPGLYVHIQRVAVLKTFCTVQKIVPE
jgi:hypothetical protein